MNWHTRQMREREREANEAFLRPKSTKPKWKVPKDFHCNYPGCIQEIGSSMCKMDRKTGKPCPYYSKLLEMAKNGELEREEV